tara:strand:- start:339 stop:647 length:309 start_codon:yes stop_codon:yes gene_type:complete
MDLKIEWIPMTIEKWYKNPPCDTFWIVKGNNSDGTEMGYFKGFDELTDEDADFFLDNVNYYYLNKIDNENRDIYLQSLNIYNNNQIENIVHMRAPLLKLLEN